MIKGVSEMRICLAHRWYQTTKHEMVCHWPENLYSIGMYILISHSSARVQATGGFGLSKFLLAIRGEKRSIPTVSKPMQKYKAPSGWGPVPSPAIHPKKIPGIFTAGHWVRTWLPSWSWCLWCCTSAPFRRCWWTPYPESCQRASPGHSVLGGSSSSPFRPWLYIAVIAVSSWEE